MKTKLKISIVLTALFALLLFASSVAMAFDFVYVNVNTTTSTAEFEWKTTDATKYELRYSEQGSGTVMMITGTEYLVTNIKTITNLKDDTIYEYSIKSINAIGETQLYEGTFKTKDNTPPGEVKDLYSSEQTSKTITLSWNPPVDEDLSHYVIFLNNKQHDNTTETTYQLTDLTPDTEYTIGVSSVDNSGNIATAVEITERTAIPNYPAIFDDSLSVHGLTATAFWKTFREGNSKIEYGTTETLGTTIEKTENTFEHEIFIDGLESNKTYYYKLTSCNNKGCDETNINQFKTPVYDPVFISITPFPTTVNSHEFMLQGNTTPNSKISAYSGSNLNAQTTADDNGNFVIYLRLKEGENNINLIAEDYIGATTEAQIKIYSDTRAPQLEIEDIPEIVTDENSILTITPSEYVNIKIFVIPEEFNNLPPTVKNLVAENNDNIVLLKWDQLVDEESNPIEKIKEFVILRDGNYLGKVSSSQTTFEDDKISPSKEYSYSVFAVSNYCLFGGVSKPARVITSNSVDNTEQLPDEEYQCIKVPDKEQETGGMFQFNFRTFVKQGKNKIIIQASDEAGNTIEKEYDFYYDSDDPIIEETNLNEITPTFSKVVKIVGKVSEQSTVYAILNNGTTDKKEYSVKTDEQGYFELEVSISQSVLVSVDEGRTTETNVGIGDIEVTNKIILYAVDNADRRSREIEEDIIYRPCGSDEYIQLEGEEIWPSTLNPRDLINRNAQLTLYYTISQNYLAIDTETLDNPVVGTPQLNVPPQFGQDILEQYDYDWIRGAHLRMTPMKDAMAIYMNFVIPEEVKREIEESKGKKWDDLTEMEKENAIYEYASLTKPLKILYTVEIPYSTIGNDGKTEVKTSKVCKEIQISIDKPISLSGVVSKNIEKINSFLDGLAETTKAVNQLSNYAMIAGRSSCYLTFIWHIYKWIDATYSCGEYLPIVMKDGADATINNNGADDTTENNKLKACKDKIADVNQYKLEWLQNSCHRVSCEQVPSLKAYVEKNRYNPSHACFGLSYDSVMDILSKELNKVPTPTTSNLNKEVVNKFLKVNEDNKYERWLYKVKDDKSCLLAYHDDYSTAMGFDFNGEDPNILVLNYCNEYPDKCGKKTWRFTSVSSICQKVNEKINGYQIELIPRDENGNSIADEFKTNDDKPVRILAVINGDMVKVMFGTESDRGEITNTQTQQDKYVIDNRHFYVPFFGYEFDYTQPGFGGFNENSYNNELESKKIKGLSELDFKQTFVNQIGNKKRTILFDPESNLLNSISSVCISGIQSYSAQYLGFIGATQACFASAAYTGVRDSKACQDLFSTYVCDLTSSLVDCTLKLAIGKEKPVLGMDIDSAKKVLKDGFDQFRFGFSQAMREASRFGPVADLRAILNLKSVARGACLWYFGLDRVDASSIFSNLILTDKRVAIAPTIQPIKVQRRFMTFDPQTGYAKYEYTATVLVSSSTDARVQLELVCSDALNCDMEECDCIYSGEENAILGSMILKEGESNATQFRRVISSKKRYDKLRISYRWKNSNGVFVDGDVQEIAIENIGDIPGFCNLDPLSMEFKCQTGFASQGYAYLVEPINVGYSSSTKEITVNVGVVNNFQSANAYDPNSIVFVKSKIEGTHGDGEYFATSNAIYPAPMTYSTLRIDISSLLPTSSEIKTKLSDTTYVKSITLNMKKPGSGEITESDRTSAISTCGGLYGEWGLSKDNDNDNLLKLTKGTITIKIDKNTKRGVYTCGESRHSIVVVLNKLLDGDENNKKTTIASEIKTTTAKTMKVTTTLYHSNSMGNAPNLMNPVEQMGVQPTQITQSIDIS